MTAFQIYLLTRCEPIRELTTAGSIFGLVALLFSVGPYLVHYMDMSKEFRRKAFVAICVLATVWIFSVATFVAMPSKEDLAIIFAGSWATNSEEMKRLPDNVVKTINKFMDDYNKEPSK